MQRYVENKHAPAVKFIRIHGRIIPIVGGKKSYSAGKVLNNEIDRLNMEVDIAEAGKRVQLNDGSWMGHKSTFPAHFKKLNFKTKNEWNKAIERKQGPAFEKILNLASHSKEFKVATKQLYDNKYVVFKTIQEKVRPIRLKDKETYDFYAWNAKRK